MLLWLFWWFCLILIQFSTDFSFQLYLHIFQVIWCLSLTSYSLQVFAFAFVVVFQWCPSDSKSPHVFWALLGILAKFDNFFGLDGLGFYFDFQIIRFPSKSLFIACCTAIETTKNSSIYTNINYFFILRQRRLCEVGIQSGRVCTYLSSVVGTFLWSSATGSWQVCLSDQRVSAFSPKLLRLYIVFSSPVWKYECPLRPRIFLFLAYYQNLTPSFPIILLNLSANGNNRHSIRRQ